jgi:ribosomal protein L29
VPQQSVQQPVQQPSPCQSEPQVLLPPVPSSPLTAQNLAQYSDSVQPQLAEMCRSKTLEVLRDHTASRRHGIPMHNTMLARLSKDDLREENAQLKSEIVALRMEISKRRAGVAQSDVSCTSHQVRKLIA